MMSIKRSDYGSALEWLSDLKKDEAWQSQLQQLQTSAPEDIGTHREDAIRRIGKGDTYEFWEIHRHKADMAIREVWDIAELSLPKLKIQAIGMLSMEWIEQKKENIKKERAHAREMKEPPAELLTTEAQKIWSKLRKAGFIVADGFDLSEGISNNQAAYIADSMARQLMIKKKWKVFEQLWGISNMAQLAGAWQQTGKLPPRASDIDEAME